MCPLFGFINNSFVNTILLFLVLCLSVYDALRCTLLEDCQLDQSHQCSICNESQCMNPFSTLFDVSDNVADKCLYKTQCDAEPCKFGKCMDGFGGPLCICDNSHHGYYCDKFAKDPAGEIARNVHYSYPWLVIMGDIKNIIELVPEIYGIRPETTARYSVGGYTQDAWGEEMPGHCKMPKVGTTEIDTSLRNCTYHFFLQLRLPYLPYHSNRIMSSNILQGYFTNINITIRNQGDPQIINAHKKSIEVFVTTDSSSQDRHRCSCLIKLQGCGKVLETPVTYYRSNKITIDSILFFYYDGLQPSLSATSDSRCKEDSIFTWRVWEFKHDFFNHNELDENEGPDYSKVADQQVVYNPYTFGPGHYKLVLDVKYAPTGNPALNFAWGYFDVHLEPLVLYIHEGSDRQIVYHGRQHRVFLTEGIHLTSSLSSDPNYQPSKRNQKHVNIEWTCLTKEKNNTKTKCEFKKEQLKVWETYDMDPSRLDYDTKYTFAVRLWTDRYKGKGKDIEKLMGPKTANFSVLVSLRGAYELLNIECRKNCGGFVVTNEELILEVRSLFYNFTKNDAFTWMYNKEGEDSQLIPESRMVIMYPSTFLILKENTLENDAFYEISVKHSRNLPVIPYYLHTIKFMAYDGECKIEPLSGQKGVTEFNIICISDNYRYPYLFEFYDKYEEEIEEDLLYSGRMLGHSFSGELLHIILTRGIVMVYIINQDGLSSSHRINVTLSDVKVTKEYLGTVEHNMTVLLEEGQVGRILRYLSFVPDIFEPVIARDKMIMKLLDATFKLTISSIPECKLATSTVKNIVVSMNINKDCYLPMLMIKNTMKRIRKTTEEMDKYLKNIGDLGNRKKYIDSKTVQNVTTYIIDTLYYLLLYANNDTYDEDENFIDFDLSVQLKLSTKYAIIILDSVKNILTYMQFPVKPAKIFSVDKAYMVWVITNHVDFSFLDVLNLNKDLRQVFISDRLMENLLKNIHDSDEKITLQVADCKQNIAWWSQGHVKSNVLSTGIVKHNAAGILKKILTFNEPVDMMFNMLDIQELNFTDTVKQWDSNQDPLFLDLNVKVFRLDLPPGTFTHISFLYPPTQDPLRVLVMKNYHPDNDMMIKTATIVNETSSLITIKNYIFDYNPIHYMGILPGPEVQILSSSEFTFKINTTNCQQWHMGRWSGKNCDFRKNSNNHAVVCSCKHLSLFSVGVINASTYFETYRDFKMLLVIHNNYLILIVTLLLVFLYLIACIWGVCQDKRDKYLRIISILDDNYPQDQNIYLISVWTSARLGAGTTAHVAIRLHGEDNQSRVHILSSGMYNVLRRNTDNWFLVLCPRPLGNLYILQVWHDNYGSSPDWFCNKICVYDLKSNVEYIFPIHQWLALRLDEYPEAAVLPAYIDDLKNKKKTLMENLRYEMREGHLVTSIILRHARSYITRFERLTILLCCVMIAMSWSVFYYTSVSHLGFDDWNTDFAVRDILLSLQIFVINFIFIMLITFAFRKSAKFTFKQFQSSIRIRTQSTAQLKLLKSMKAKDLQLGKLEESETIGYKELFGTSMFEKFVRALYTFKRIQSKVPVHLPHATANVKVRKLWFIAAWAVCITIIVTSVVFLVNRSVTLGDNQSQKCIFCALLGVSEEIFIFGPLEILAFCSLFSIGLKLIVDPPAYTVNINDLKNYRKLFDNNEHYLKLINIRCHPMYRPIRILDRESYLLKMLKYYRWSVVWDFLIILVFVVSLSSIIFSLWPSQYYSNHHTKQIFTLGHSKIGTVDFFDINTTTDSSLYLLQTFMRTVYLLRWYNGQLISTISKDLDAHSYRMSDYTRKVLGRPLIRQLRVKPEPCNNLMGAGNRICIPHYSLSKEDKTVYGVGWKPAEWRESDMEYSPWEYNDRSISWVHKQFTGFGGMWKELNYGGYMVYLSPYRFDSILMITELNEQNWLDHLTKALIIDVTIYNVNQNLFSHITMFMEHSNAVQCFHRIMVFTVPKSKSINLSDFICIFIVVYFIFTTLRRINKEGLFHYFSTTGNTLQVLIITFSGLVIIFIILHFDHAKSSVAKFETITQLGHFDFDAFVYYFRLAQIAMCVLLFIAIIQLLYLLKIGRFITCCYVAFKMNFSNTAILVSILILATTVQWRFIAFLLNATIYSRIIEAFIESFRISLCSSCPKPIYQGVRVNFFFTVFFIKITMFVLVVLFINYIKVARKIVTYSFNFLAFVINEMKEFKFCKKS